MALSGGISGEDSAMKPPPFEYSRPSTVADAVGLLAQAGDEGKLLAGGQSLVPLLNFRLASPRLIVDLNRVAELSYTRRDNGMLRLGAMTRTRELETSHEIATANPLVAHAAHWIGHVQIRNRGTVGGSLAHADPAAELPALCVLLGAELKVRGQNGERSVAAEGFFHGLMTTGLNSDDVLTELAIPVLPAGTKWGFREFAQRHGDFAVAGAACTLGRDEARLVLFGVTDAPVRCIEAERELSRRVDSKALDAALAAARRQLAQSDDGGRRAYQRQVAEVMLRRALEDAAGRGQS
jgi:aerobic carbon-monoxide dehydrogenase medium subunit